MGSLNTLIEGIANIVGGVSGVRSAPAYPTGNIPPLPFAITYPESGTYEVQPGGIKRALHTITVDLHFSRQETARNIDSATALLDSIVVAIFAAMRDGTLIIDGTGEIEYTLAAMSYAGIATIGYRITLRDVKIRD